MDGARLYSTEEAAAELGIEASLIRTWKHRGRVAPRQFIVGRGRDGVVPVYAIENLSPLAKAVPKASTTSVSTTHVLTCLSERCPPSA